MRVHIIYTGGTIGMVDSPHGLVPGADLEGWLNTLLRAHGSDGSDHEVTISRLNPLIDSANATPASWQAIVDELRRYSIQDPDKPFVVLHGTDTMAYTSAALSYALTDLPVPVVVTGSQLPLGAVGSDAAANTMGALHAATSTRVTGVSLFFGQRLLAGARATKTSSWAFAGFDSPNAPPLAIAGAPWQWSPLPVQGTGWRGALPYRCHDVAVIDLVPGLGAARLGAALRPLPDAVVLRAFGVGTVPGNDPGLIGVLADAIGSGVAVVVTSQCHQAEVALGRYQAGEALARAGGVGSRDMTLEATYAKVQFLLGQGLRGAELASWIGRPIAGELTPAAST